MLALPRLVIPAEIVQGVSPKGGVPMHDRMERFGGRVEQQFGRRPGRGAWSPEELRAEAVCLALVAFAEGDSLGSAAGELGLGTVTLER